MKRRATKKQVTRVPAAALLAWFDEHKRDMPWRRTRDPYAIWLSEIMLQQTRVETVVAYWTKFLQKWPTVVDLAKAPIDEVLAAWAGLGYYARARNLHAAAKKIRDEHGGTFPSTPEAVRELPGVGRYTAGAILSIAFEKPEPLVDGNVVRVLARVHALGGHAKDPKLHAACWEIADVIVPEKRPGDFNQSLMELGATVCTPAKPRCDTCPIAKTCLARERGTADEIPATPPKAKRPHRQIDAAFVQRNGAILLVRRPDEGLLGGLWELPSAERDGSPGSAAERALAEIGLRADLGEKLASVDHAFSHFDMTLEAFACETEGKLARGIRAEFVARERLAEYGVGAATKRAIEAALEAARQPSLFAGKRSRR
ncbi:MAG TPA: A/G-specific adenine glycosylase [bacterium]|nr:A/G-specific adenine glycosylase [bacterium]